MSGPVEVPAKRSRFNGTGSSQGSWQPSGGGFEAFDSIATLWQEAPAAYNLPGDNPYAERKLGDQEGLP